MKKLIVLIILLLSVSIFAQKADDDYYTIYNNDGVIGKILKVDLLRALNSYVYLTEVYKAEADGRIEIKLVKANDSWVENGKSYDYQFRIFWYNEDGKCIKKLYIMFNSKDKSSGI